MLNAVRICADWGFVLFVAVVEVAGLRLLTKDDFYEFLEECGDKLAVVDFFTDWCVPHGRVN